MDIRPSDLAGLKKEIERIRRHEESHQAREAEGKTESPPDATPQPTSSEQDTPVPLLDRVREIVAALFIGPSPSKEGLEVLPDYVVTVVQVIAEEPKFRGWLLRLHGLGRAYRNEQLERMAYAFRVEDGDSHIAATFDRLHDDALFDAVCKFIGQERNTST